MWNRISLLITAATLVTASSAVGQEAINPKLAASWNFMQVSMPGVSYKLLEDACKEGAVAIYNGTWGEAQRNQVAAFKKRFSCLNVSTFELATAPRRERFLAETRAGQYLVDIVQDTDPGVLNEQVKAGLLMNYKISNDSYFEETVKVSGYWYPLRIAIAGNAWNTDKVTPEETKSLSTWEGVINPAFKGRAGITDPAQGGAVFLPFYGLYKIYGEEFMKKFAALKPRIFDLNQLGSALASGDIDVALAVSETPLTTMYLAGAPIQWALPEPGFGPATGQAIAARAPHPNAAKLYQEYSYTEEGYGAWQKLGGPPARNGFKDQREFANEGWYKYPTKFFPADPDQVTSERDTFTAKFNEWFKK
jgi:iron(III) transport system substrate-binding protein